MASASSGARQAPERDIFKVAITALTGTSIEWYDFFIYGTAAALVFPALFFPDFSSLAGTLDRSLPSGLPSWPGRSAGRSSDITATR
jgi:hypothetical protein